ncbi:P-loop NTPase fold protein [Raoultibacter phocaeensis]|uniref:P-loop NTPase fold protein n=1 Tax=Raoultibacter phocaeensis TaxID=2479841 RepID=UPI0011183BF8|nr:P-loop NTPase fold protein [Raoultibacter phocaeensis]
MNEDSVKTMVRDYLEDTDKYAFMIEGAWGSGKTHFVEHGLRDAAEGYRIVRVSLFGTSSASDLYDRLYLGIINEYASGGEGEGRKAIVAEFARDAGLSFLGGVAKKAKKELGISYEIGTKALAEFLLGSSMLLVFDDLERCLISERELFGIVDSLVNGKSRKVILVSNEAHRESDQDDANSHKALMEKLVWRRCTYEPPMEEIVGNMIGAELSSIDPSAEKVFLKALANAKCTNIRTVKRLRRLMGDLGKTDFFMNPADRSIRMSVFQDVCSFSIRAAEGYFPQPSDVTPADPADIVSSMESAHRADSYRRYESLAFIRAHFEWHQKLDGNQMESCLGSYREAYYPESEKVRDAVEWMDRWKSLMFRNDDVPAMIACFKKAINPQDGSLGLPFERYGELLRIVKSIGEAFPDIHDGSLKDFTQYMKEAIRRNPDKAMASVCSNPFDWQDRRFASPPIPGLEPLEEIDELRDFAMKLSLEDTVDSLNRSLRDDPDSFTMQYYSVLEKERIDIERMAIVLAGVEEAALASAMPSMRPESLRKLHEVFNANGMAGAFASRTLSEGSCKRLSRWAKKLAELTKIESSEEYAVRKYLGYLKNDLYDLAESMHSGTD